MNHLGLFEGIGGFSLAARWAQWETIAYSEINPFCLKLLKQHFPGADVLTDIKTTDFKKYANRIGIVTGGFPCQPFSSAGERKGTDDERHLWPEMLRAIREIKPTWVVGENVLGIINWNGGLVFEQVQIDLENEGYEVQSYILPACGQNTRHKRDRVWFVAHAKSHRLETKSARSVQTLELFKETSMGNDRRITAEWVDRRPDTGTLRGADGISDWVDRIKGLGNAIVPQVAYRIFQAINKYEETTAKK